MKRNNLSTAVIAGLVGVAGFAGVSNAVQLSADGVGQVLLYSYYTVNADQQTNFSVVNTTGDAKAVKVRFLEAYNSREVLDFNLFLSEYDVWTASVGEHAGGGAGIHTGDTSCTVSKIAGQIPFRHFGYTGTNNDTGPQGIERTREGHFEMIEMATIPTNSTAGGYITHGPGMDCSKIGPYLAGAGAADLLPPSGGLFGNAAVINVGEGTMYSYAADAIDGFSIDVMYSPSASLLPSLRNAKTAPTGEATAHVFMPGGQLISATYPAGNNIDAVSAVFATTNVYNEWINDPSIGADSEWIVSFPTKRFYVDPAIVGVTAIAPFTNVFDDGISCDTVGLAVWDREENLLPDAPGCGFSPCPPALPASSLCYETQVITFGQDGVGASDVLGSDLSMNISLTPVGGSAPFADSGWLNLSFPGANMMRADINGNQFHGLPVNGHLVQRFINANANPGMLSNYSGMFRHRTERSCSVDGELGACS